MSARSRRLQNSMGSSWDDGGYSPDEDVSVHSASDSDVDLSASDQDMVQEDTDKATPLLSRTTRASSNQQYETPTKTPSRATASHSKAGSSRGTPRSVKSSRSTSRSAEPSFIYPKVSGSKSLNRLMDDYSNSPTVYRKRQEFGTPRSFKEEPTEEQELGPWHYVNIFYQNVARPLMVYMLEIFGYANRHFLKPFFGIALAFGILYFGIQMASGLLHAKIASAMAPVCSLPGSSYLFSMCQHTPLAQNASFDDLLDVQHNFEDILQAQQETMTLPGTLKDSELVVRDLRILVKHSKLPSRVQLDLEFQNFLLGSTQGGADLQSFNSKIGAATGRIVSMNELTVATLEGIDEKQKSIGSVGRVFNAMTGAFVSPPLTLEQRIFEQYVLLISKNKEEITDLITAASGLLHVLQGLDDRLDTIYSLAVHDDQTISKNQDELFAQLWTRVGGNSVQVKANAKQLNLLANISAYRRQALKHVASTLLKLQEIEAELNNLRDAIAAPELLGWRGLPIQYHIDQMNRATAQLSLARGISQNTEEETKRNRIKAMDSVRSETLEIGRGTDIPVIPVKSTQLSVN